MDFGVAWALREARQKPCCGLSMQCQVTEVFLDRFRIPATPRYTILFALAATAKHSPEGELVRPLLISLTDTYGRTLAASSLQI